MPAYLIVVFIALPAVGSLIFYTLTYSLREMSRVRLADFLQRRGLEKWVEPTTEHQPDLVFVTAVFRLLCNTAIVLTSLWWAERITHSTSARYLVAAGVATIVTLFCSVMVPNALTRHSGDAIVGSSVRLLHALRVALMPVTKLMHVIDELVRRGVGRAGSPEPQAIENEIEKEILSVIEEGEKEGVVDEEEREMIQSVIQFHDTTAGQIMTARPEIVGIEAAATLDHVKKMLEESGHSRLPVYDGTLDHVVGILYARDLLKHVGTREAPAFSVRSTMRPAFFVPETKPLSDLLHDFRLQKIHIAIVLDEYGGTAGLATIEDVLEELVGDISDEHEPVEPAMFNRIDDHNMEADARIYIDELNRLAGLNLPEDAGYDTLGGFVSNTLGRIPEAGAEFQHDGARFIVLDAEPQRVKRVRIELTPLPTEGEAEAPPTPAPAEVEVPRERTPQSREPAGAGTAREG
jgi:putative hemolysin